MDELLLIPRPKKACPSIGTWPLPAVGTISLNFRDDAVRAAAQRLRASLPHDRAKTWRIATLDQPLNKAMEIHLRLDRRVRHPQGYEIYIARDGVTAVAATPQGMFYAVETLIQIARQSGEKWPGIAIQDQPMFEHRGFYHDISRGKVPTLATILGIIDDLAALKINEFQLYIENVFAFQNHPDIYGDTDALSAEEILEIDAACRARFIDFVPSISSLGHFEKILQRPAYRALAEAGPDGEPWSLCPTDRRAKKLLEEMYAEFLPNFSSRRVNICCDESWDLGKGRSAALAEQIGVGRLYLQWVQFCDSLARKHGKRIELWGDIILNYPQLVAELPPEAIVLEWGYESDHPFDRDAALFAASGRSFYVCPGTSCWNSIAGRTENAFATMRRAAKAGVANHAAGFLNTDWGDGGHQQMLSVSYLPMAFGAAVSWNPTDSADREVIAAASRHVFQAESDDFARAVADLGDVHIAREPINAALEFLLFREPWDQTKQLERVRRGGLKTQLKRVEMLREKIAAAALHRPDAKLVRDEMVFSADTILHVLERTQARLAKPTTSSFGVQALFARLSAQSGRLCRNFKRLWAERNKPSHMEATLAHFLSLRREYGLRMAKCEKRR
ncbi:MAG: family 20 glycosylhydrolase [Phycisphaerae bacterium]|nr:family 20 glycosylhydrolase [Phycisphaerae bacterium]